MQVAQKPGYASAASMVPMNLIDAGKNPRRFFHPKKMEELAASVAKKGVYTPILLTPIDGGRYEIVAGERRYRASIMAGKDEIPAVIRSMTDEEAWDAAVIENTQRENMAPSEEARAAAHTLGECNGNRDEAANRLTWSRATLDKRLALMNCSDGVLDALDEQKITLGHAELLAAVTKAKQNGVLEKLLAAPTLPVVAQLKTMLQGIAKELASAIFDKAECAACPHNSEVQGALFGESIAAGHCTNGDCFDAKTAGVLEAKMAELRDEYPTIRIVNVGENETLKQVRAEGALGLGDEQAKACRACANFGAAVSNIPGKQGKVFKDLCFDPVCNAKKVALRIKADKAATEKQAVKAEPTKATSSAGTAAKKVVAAAAAPVVQDSNRIKEYREKVWRKTYAKVAFSNKEKNAPLLIALAVTGLARHVSSTKMADAFKQLTKDEVSRTDLGKAATLIAAHPEVEQTMLEGIAAAMQTDLEIRHIQEALRFLQVNLADCWTMDEEFLKLLTKSEIEAVCDELGIKAHLGEKYAKVMGQKKDEIIKGLLAIDGFEYKGKVPKAMMWKEV